MKPIKTIRRETSLIEGICEHGIGHPLYASIHWLVIHGEEPHSTPEHSHWGVHGCDGCCSDSEWQIETLKESVRIANQIIVNGQEYVNKLNEQLRSRDCELFKY